MFPLKVAPDNGWLEDDRFLLGPGPFSGAFAVSFVEGASQKYLTNGTTKIGGLGRCFSFYFEGLFSASKC